MRKRGLGLLLSGCILLSCLTACGGGGGSSSSQGSASLPEEPSISVIAPVPEPEPEPEPVVYPYTNPLTGEGLEEDIGARRPIAIMLNNLEKALPQLGVSQADVIYEIVAEGGITRMMALFQDVEGVGDLGSVRSARDYYVSLANGHDAIYVHAGGSDQAYISIKNWGVTAIDFVNGPYGNMCWRDQDRRKNAGLEHSLLTSSEKLLEQMPSRFRQEHEEGFQVGWTFSEEAPAGGQTAGTLTVPFSSYKTGHFTYDADQGGYLIRQHINGHDRDYVDGNTDQDVVVSNVLVLYTDIAAVKGDTAGRQSVRTTGSGEGLLLRDGQLYPITWERESRSDRLSFLDGSGQPIPLAVGHSYINIVSRSADVTWS